MVLQSEDIDGVKKFSSMASIKTKRRILPFLNTDILPRAVEDRHPIGEKKRIKEKIDVHEDQEDINFCKSSDTNIKKMIDKNQVKEENENVHTISFSKTSPNTPLTCSTSSSPSSLSPSTFTTLFEKNVSLISQDDEGEENLPEGCKKQEMEGEVETAGGKGRNYYHYEGDPFPSCGSPSLRSCSSSDSLSSTSLSPSVTWSINNSAFHSIVGSPVRVKNVLDSNIESNLRLCLEMQKVRDSRRNAGTFAPSSLISMNSATISSSLKDSESTTLSPNSVLRQGGNFTGKSEETEVKDDIKDQNVMENCLFTAKQKTCLSDHGEKLNPETNSNRNLKYLSSRNCPHTDAANSTKFHGDDYTINSDIDSSYIDVSEEAFRYNRSYWMSKNNLLSESTLNELTSNKEGNQRINVNKRREMNLDIHYRRDMMNDLLLSIMALNEKFNDLSKRVARIEEVYGRCRRNDFHNNWNTSNALHSVDHDKTKSKLMFSIPQNESPVSSSVNSKIPSVGYKIIDIKAVPPNHHQRASPAASWILSTPSRPSTKSTLLLSKSYDNPSSRNRIRSSSSFPSYSSSISPSSSLSSSNDTVLGNRDSLSG